MKQATEKRYEIFFREFEGIGAVLEELQEKVINLDYGKYDIRGLELEKRVALKILEGMFEFQKMHNKGLRFDSIFKDGAIEIYNIEEEQKRHDELIMNLNL